MQFLIILFAIILLLLLIVKKLNPFLALLVVSIATGFALGMTPGKILMAVQNGAGSTLGSVALVIVLGAILGKWMEISGAAHQITRTLVKSFGIKHIQWAMMLTGFLVGLPMFYNAGFVILIPLVFTVALETGLPLLYIGLPMAASLSVTHGLLPPHPAPLALASMFGANTGKTLLYGLIIAIPSVIIAGPLLGRSLKRIHASPPPALVEKSSDSRKPVLSPFLAFAIALLPVAIILLCLAVHLITPSSKWDAYFVFAGDPVIAFLISVLLTLLVLSGKNEMRIETLMKSAADAVGGVALIIMIIAAGGVFKQVLVDSGIGDNIRDLSIQLNLPPLVLGWLAAAFLRVTLGSATVAGLTAAGIVAPIVAKGGVSPELMVLAVGSGSLMFSHVNDTGFWMFKEYFNITVKETFLSWTVMETIISILGLCGVLLIQFAIR
jgi:gluconate transporter